MRTTPSSPLLLLWSTSFFQADFALVCQPKAAEYTISSVVIMFSSDIHNFGKLQFFYYSKRTLNRIPRSHCRTISDMSTVLAVTSLLYIVQSINISCACSVGLQNFPCSSFQAAIIYLSLFRLNHLQFSTSHCLHYHQYFI